MPPTSPAPELSGDGVIVSDFLSIDISAEEDGNVVEYSIILSHDTDDCFSQHSLRL